MRYLRQEGQPQTREDVLKWLKNEFKPTVRPKKIRGAKRKKLSLPCHSGTLTESAISNVNDVATTSASTSDNSFSPIESSTPKVSVASDETLTQSRGTSKKALAKVRKRKISSSSSDIEN